LILCERDDSAHAATSVGAESRDVSVRTSVFPGGEAGEVALFALAPDLHCVKEVTNVVYNGVDFKIGVVEFLNNQWRSKMTTKPAPTTDVLFQGWKEEHCELDRQAMELSVWLHDQSKLRAAQFREAVSRISDLKERLTSHFKNEELICEELLKQRGWGSHESQAVQRQSNRDHEVISSRLKHLIDRMQEGESDCDSWTTGVRELNLILDVLEQHEEQEEESVGSLLPRVDCATYKGKQK
jgi:iron-sulfur cluster repair protein YtfE (RIC family)